MIDICPHKFYILNTVIKTQGAKIITREELKNLRYPLPESWKKAAGMLKGKKQIVPLRYQREIRREWEKRLKR